MSLSNSHNITLATLFAQGVSTNSSSQTVYSSGYTGLQVDFNTLVENNIDSFNINGNVINVNGSNLSVILPNTCAIGVDKATGNWVINGILTQHRAKGIDGTVKFDDLTSNQRKQLSFNSVSVKTLLPGQKAKAEIIDKTPLTDEFAFVDRQLQLSVPKGDRGDVLWAQFQIDKEGNLIMISTDTYHGLQFSIDDSGYLQFDTADITGRNQNVIIQDGLMCFAQLQQDELYCYTGQDLIKSDENISYDVKDNIACVYLKNTNISIQDNNNIFKKNLSDYSLCFWVRVNESINFMDIIGDLGGNVVNLYDNQIYFIDYNSAEDFSSSGLEYNGFELLNNKWYFISLLYNNDDNQLHIYVNCVLDNILSNIDAKFDTNNFKIGKVNNNCDCYISSIRLYNRILSGTQLNALFKQFELTE